MVKTYGLTPVAIAVRDLDRTQVFYSAVLGGEFVPGEPYLFATDPDGYTFEIWYEVPTPVDPPA
jgi:catechol 2,3-dioxygenase-like lactoylglutathione lyase family enzyme